MIKKYICEKINVAIYYKVQIYSTNDSNDYKNDEILNHMLDMNWKFWFMWFHK
jgi:hypothetical protein